ncbi:MAG: DUF6273 domain-containing protein, partial [Erysipelotrichaceae bacterium]|nr:DUF6273 domain-containing protein [Erysipelotrichaceae bacterium]
PDDFVGEIYFDNGDAVIEGNTYYFKVEPIKWRIIDAENGVILADKLHGRYLFNDTSVRWHESLLQGYLNNNWFPFIFTDEERSLVINTRHEYDDSFYSDTYVHTTSSDYMYLLSAAEYMNPTYGFSNTTSADSARVCVVSDYARATGIGLNSPNTGYYYTRTPISQDEMVCFSGEDGQLITASYQDTRCGIRPAMVIDPSVLSARIIGDYLKGDLEIDVSSSINPDNPMGPFHSYFEILDDTWTEISYIVADRLYPEFNSVKLVIHHDTLTADVYYFDTTNDEFMLYPNPDEIVDDLWMQDNYLYLDVTLGFSVGYGYHFNTTIEAKNAANATQIINDVLYVTHSGERKVIGDYLHDEVVINEDETATFYFEVFNPNVNSITYTMTPVAGGPTIVHEVLNDGIDVTWTERVINETTESELDLTSLIAISQNDAMTATIISVTIPVNNSKYPLNEVWNIDIGVVCSGADNWQWLYSQLVLRPYAPIISDYTNGTIPTEDTQDLVNYVIEFSDLNWTNIEIIARSRGTLNAVILRLVLKNGYVNIMVYSTVHGSGVETPLLTNYVVPLIGNTLSMDFDVNTISVGVWYDISITARGQNKRTQVVKTDVFYDIGMAERDVMVDYSHGDTPLYFENADTRLDVSFEMKISDGAPTYFFYTMTSKEDPKAFYVFETRNSSTYFDMYYDGILMNSSDNYTADFASLEISPNSSENFIVRLRPLVERTDFEFETFDVLVEVRLNNGLTQRVYSEITWTS